MRIEPDDLTRPQVLALLQEHLDNMNELSPPESMHALDVSKLRAPATQRLWRAHRLHLSVAGRELLQRPAAQQLIAFPHRPEGDAGRTQLRDVEGVHALRRRKLVHVGEVLVQQRQHLGAREVVGFDSHG